MYVNVFFNPRISKVCVKGQRVNILVLQSTRSLSQLLSSACGVEAWGSGEYLGSDKTGKGSWLDLAQGL